MTAPDDCRALLGRLRTALVVLVCGFSTVAFSQDEFNAGFLYDQFRLTLDSGRRTEAVGPLFYDEQKGAEKTWALPPFFSRYANPEVETREYDFLYPVCTYEYYGRESRWQFF